MDTIKCCLCGATVPLMQSHNPAPLNRRRDDRCCGDCNDMFVIPSRLQKLMMRLDKCETKSE